MCVWKSIPRLYTYIFLLFHIHIYFYTFIYMDLYIINIHTLYIYIYTIFLTENYDAAFFIHIMNKKNLSPPRKKRLSNTILTI